MSVGIVMLVHNAFDRAEQVARHWAAAGCPVVIHIDKAVPRRAHDAFVAALSDLKDVHFSPRKRCEWGTWGIVAASQGAAELMLSRFPKVRHVYLASGSCLPLRPVQELIDYLEDRPQTDFIESATTADVPWTVGGLDEERFTLR
ncbi:MAG: beta-1,6-N-acetylglucosaminyltransferase, partial [Alphaproteobacteria bacterium]